MYKNKTNRAPARRPAPALEHAPDLKAVFSDVDKAARDLMYTLASALATDFDEAAPDRLHEPAAGDYDFNSSRQASVMVRMHAAAEAKR